MKEDIAAKLESFFSRFSALKYRKGEILIRAGDAPLGVFYLKRGNVKEYFISRSGEEIVVNIFKPYAFFPMSWAINGSENNYFFEAMGELELVRAPKEDVVDFLKSEPEVTYDLLSRLYKGTDGLLTRMTYLMGGDAYSRLIAEMIIIARRFGTDDKGKITFSSSEKDLAAQTGMTRETISRTLKALSDKKLLRYTKGKIEIFDLKALERELASY